MIQHLIWDVDGTLFDTYPAIARSMQAAAHDLGAPATYDEVMRLALVSVDHCRHHLVRHLRRGRRSTGRTFCDQHYQTVTPEDQPPFAGVEAVCEHIRSRGGLNLIVTHRRRAGTRSAVGDPSSDRLLHRHHQQR